MLVLRILVVLVALAVAASLVVFVATRDRRWLWFAVQVLTYGLIVAAAIIGLIALERLLVAI
jgi:uncharacterized membrane protein